MKNKILAAGIILCILSTFCFTSCEKYRSKKEINIEKIKEVRADQKWAVIITPYVVYTEEPSANSKSLANGRRADIQMICGKRITKNSENEKAIWYRLESGWVEDQNIYICKNRFQAENYAKTVKN